MTAFIRILSVTLAILLAQVARADLTLKDTTGADVHPLTVASTDKATVIIFALNDCPISNSYAPAIAELHKQFAPQGVKFYIVYCDADLSAVDVAKHQKDFEIPATALLDPDAALAKKLDADVTAEVVVLKPDGSVAYRGPIDDQYAAVGRKRTTVGHAYLTDALTDLLANRPIKVASAEAYGCPLKKD